MGTSNKCSLSFNSQPIGSDLCRSQAGRVQAGCSFDLLEIGPAMELGRGSESRVLINDAILAEKGIYFGLPVAKRNEQIHGIL